ncbi:MAG: low-specificity L-threonine aldolase [Chloroflexi bacterium]|nr:low-specificity L-threonine aldolase [Chloroflexota bacterium]MDA1146637.1 low-specificity L-threonine aldolase [Chloroflexota bacterium]MQC82821.1 low-specificity L-threonine aldolase [Chloroflexota bacterium]
MPNLIDLRSDTVTRPVPAMLAAMTSAEVGDDVLGDDPSVKALEAAAARAVGKEAAMFVPSGTMANLVALLTHCGRGDEAIVGSESHILHYEGVGAPALGGISLRAVINDSGGHIDPAAVASVIRIGTPRTTVVCLENTQNRCGGAAIPAQEMRDIAEVAHAAGAAVHVDGARIFNAAAALETDAASLVASADTISFCFSKGLGAPVGSVLTGPADFIARARPLRRQVGGGMRQSGLLAAAALYALDNHVERLAEDHANARRLADGLAALPGIDLDPDSVGTNMVFFEPRGIDGRALQAALRERGVLSTGTPDRIRMVTHLDVTTAQIDEALSIIGEVVAGMTGG